MTRAVEGGGKRPADEHFFDAHRVAIAELDPLVRRIYEVIDGGVLGVGRHSTQEQLRKCEGSAEWQRSQLRVLEPYGVDPDGIRFVHHAESASGRTDRPGFREVLRCIRAGEVRMIVAAFTDRLGRRTNELRELIAELEKVGGMLVLGGHFYDLTNPAHRMVVGIQAEIAEFESVMRVIRLVSATCSSAKRLRYPIRLPTGLIWANPLDRAYLDRVEGMDIADWLSQVPDRCRTQVKDKRKGGDLYVLPFPDPIVFECCRLQKEVLLKTRDLRQVIDFILTKNSGWPGPQGMVPRRRGSSIFGREYRVEWTPLGELRNDNDQAYTRDIVGAWFRSPALYGEYTFELHELQPLPEQLRRLGGVVHEVNAFPSLFKPSEREEVVRILGNRAFRPTRVSILRRAGGELETEEQERPSWWRRKGQDPILPEVRCASRLKDGTLCGQKLHPRANERSTTWRPNYLATACNKRHPHLSALQYEHEQAIWSVVLANFDRTELTRAIREYELRQGIDRQRVLELETQAREDERDLDVLIDELVRARKAGNSANVRVLRRKLDRLTEQQRNHERLLLALKADLSFEQGVEEAEFNQLLSLGEDLPSLYERGAAVPGLRQRLLRSIIQCVWVRRVAERMDWVEIEYPSKAREGRLISVRPPRVGQPLEAWCWLALREQLDDSIFIDPTPQHWTVAERVAQEARRRWPRAAERLTSGAVARAAAQLFHRAPHDAETRPGGEPLSAIAARVGEPLESVEAAAMGSALGPAAVREGELVFAPTAVELARAFERYAGRMVAEAQGWPPERTMMAYRAARQLGVGRSNIIMRAQPYGGAVEDVAGRMWVNLDHVERPAPPTLAEAVAARGIAGIEPSDFLRADDVTAGLRTLFNTTALGIPWHHTANRQGYVLSVLAADPLKHGGVGVYIYYPPVIRSAPRDVVAAWLEGRRPDLTPWSGRRRKIPFETMLRRAERIREVRQQQDKTP